MSESKEPVAQPGADVLTETSLLDDASLRALRAVQRMVPQGPGSAGNALAGGTVPTRGAVSLEAGVPGGGAEADSLLPSSRTVAAEQRSPSNAPRVAPAADEPSAVPETSGFNTRLASSASAWVPPRVVADVAPEITHQAWPESSAPAEPHFAAMPPPIAASIPIAPPPMPAPLRPRTNPAPRQASQADTAPPLEQADAGGQPRPELSPTSSPAQPLASRPLDAPAASSPVTVPADEDGQPRPDAPPPSAPAEPLPSQPPDAPTVRPPDPIEPAPSDVPPGNAGGTMPLAPRLSGQAVAGDEDSWIPLDLTAALVDADGSETLSLRVSGLPAGAVLSAGTQQADGSWVLNPTELPGLKLQPARHDDADFTLRVQATATERAGGDTATSSLDIPVSVRAVADAPVVVVANARGAEDTPIALDLAARLVDLDGSESLSISLIGVPAGATLSSGTRQPDGTWVIAPAALAGLTMTPPADFSGTLNLTLRATATDHDGSTAVSTAAFAVQVAAVADAAIITGSGRGQEDSWITLRGTITVADTDGSEQLGALIEVRGVPSGARLSHGTETASGIWQVARSAYEDGSLAILPPANSDADIRLTIAAITQDTGGGAISQQTSLTIVTVVVQAAADAPSVVVADRQGNEDSAIRLTGLGGALTDRDGSESLSFSITGVPSGAKLSHGSLQTDGSWTLTPAQLALVSITPPAQFSGRMPLTLTAIATEAADGSPAARTSASFSVEVNPVVDAGRITGNVSGQEDTTILLRPAFSTPDNDGSEAWSMTSRISGVPAGATLTEGTPISAGVWEVSTSNLRAGLIGVTPPRNSDTDFTLTITATLTDTGNGISVSKTISGTSLVTVRAVADAPDVTAMHVTGAEDLPIPLTLTAALTDTDGSERLTVAVLGVPAGASLSRGSRAADGSWSLTAADLPGLSLIPPRDFSGAINLTLRATASDNNSSTAVSTAAFTVQVTGVADAPNLRVSAAIVREDSAIALRMAGTTTDIDGSESIVAYRVLDLPADAVLRAGGTVLVREPDGSVLVQAGMVSSLTLTPPANSDVDFTLRITAISAEPNGSRAESAAINLPVQVVAVADAPVWLRTGSEGTEDTPIPLELAAQLADRDGSEVLHYVVSGVPAGAVLDAGTFRGHGSWALTASEAAAVRLLPPRDFAGTIGLTVTAVSQERNGGDQAVRTVSFPVRVGAVVDTPAVGGLDGSSGNWGTATGREDQPIVLNLDPGLADRDGSERVVGDIAIGGVPAGAVLRLADGTAIIAGTDGQYHIAAAAMRGVTLTMPANSDVAARLTVTMTIEDTGGVRQTIGGTLVVDPAGQADTPTLAVLDSLAAGHTSADADTGWIPLQLTAALTDTDGSERLQIWVRDVPPGSALSAGVPAGNGLWLVPAALLAGLQIRPPEGYGGSITLRVSAVAIEREGGEASTAAPFVVTVTPPNNGSGGTTGGGGGGPFGAQPPQLSVATDPALEDGSAALHITVALADSDGGRETLGIRIDGVPAGASLSAGARDVETGAWVLRPDELSGLRLIPPADFAGTLSLQVTAVAAEATGDSASTSSTLAVAVEAVADGALISATPASAVEDSAVPLNLSILPGDSDGSETVIAVLLSGLSPGCRIAAGPGITDHGNGTWSVAPDHLDQVRLIPPPHAHGSFSLTVIATVQEASNGETRNTSRPVAVIVEASPDAPLLAASDAVGWEDRAIALDISAALVDQDGSEVLSIVLSGLPKGSQLSAGVNNGDGSWTLKPGDLAGLALVPPGNWSGDIALSATALVVERSTGATASTTAGFHVHVGGVADTPFVDAAVTGTGAEDQALPIDIRAQLTDQDGSEQLQLAVSGVPVGGRFSAGSPNADGSWTIPGSALSGLTFTPPANYAGTLRLDFTVSAVEIDGATASRPISVTLTVSPVADAPILTLGSAQGDEDTAIRLPISAALSDTDGSEQLLRVEITGVPTGATLSAGTRASNGSWTVLPAQLAELTLTPPANYSGRLTLSVTAVSAEAATGMEAATRASLGVDILPVADAAIVTAPAAHGTEDTALLLNLTAALGDTDGSEMISAVRMTGLPAGFSLSAGHALGGGVWELAPTDLPGLRLTPAPDWNGTTTLSLEVTSREVATGATITTAKPFAVSLAAVNDAPVLTLVPAGDPAAVGTAGTPAFAGVTASDGDSATLAGATVTLTGGAFGDTLDIGGGFSLLTVAGKTMIGSTGIEIVGGGYDSVTGSLTLRGPASPATYTAVLQGLALENTGSAGLAAGTRTIGVTLQDDQGAATAQQTVALAVQPAVLQGNGQDQILAGTAGHDTFIGSAGAETMLGGAGADLVVLMPGGGHDLIDGGSGSWVDVIQVSNAGAPGAGSWVLVVDTAGATAAPEAHAVAFDQPISGQIQFADGTQADFTQIERVTW